MRKFFLQKKHLKTIQVHIGTLKVWCLHATLAFWRPSARGILDKDVACLQRIPLNINADAGFEMRRFGRELFGPTGLVLRDTGPKEGYYEMTLSYNRPKMSEERSAPYPTPT